MNLDRAQRVLIKSLMKEEGWEVVIRFAAAKTDEWRSTAVKGENEFQTLWNVAEKEGKVGGLNEFLDALEKEAFEA